MADETKVGHGFEGPANPFSQPPTEDSCFKVVWRDGRSEVCREPRSAHSGESVTWLDCAHDLPRCGANCTITPAPAGIAEEPGEIRVGGKTREEIVSLVYRLVGSDRESIKEARVTTSAIDAWLDILFHVRSEGGGEKREAIEMIGGRTRAIVGALKSQLAAHGPISEEWIGSAAKRIEGNLRNAKEEGDGPAQEGSASAPGGPAVACPSEVSAQGRPSQTAIVAILEQHGVARLGNDPAYDAMVVDLVAALAQTEPAPSGEKGWQQWAEAMRSYIATCVSSWQGSPSLGDAIRALPIPEPPKEVSR